MQTADPVDAERELIARFFVDPAADRHSINADFELDFGVVDRAFIDGLTSAGQPNAGNDERILLPQGYVWSADGKTRAPMALCEFVAYKTALAYEAETTIRANVGNVQHFKFFDSKDDDVSDTQGYVFMYDGIAFVIMRGTENQRDWKVNLQDQLTDELQARRKWRLKRQLKKRHGSKVVSLLGDLETKPGRHLGFAIGWAAVHDKISTHLQMHCLPDMPVVLGGHSLGGALALIGARELKREGHNIAAVITFGAPQAGNEVFTQEYEAEGLRERTILFEAKGDTVPRVMRRWYYRLHRNLRERIDRFAASQAQLVPSQQYKLSGNSWIFAAQPALSDAEIEGAIKAIKAARERKAREEEERKAKDSKAEEERKAEASAQSGVAPNAADASNADTPPAPAQLASPTQTGSRNDNYTWLVVGAIAGLFLLLFLWLFVRSKRSAHAVIDRYALFLSTLSYQRIRALRVAEPGSVDEKLDRAHADLTKYMRFIRSDTGEGSYYSKSKISDLPVRLKSSLDVETFLSEGKNII